MFSIRKIASASLIALAIVGCQEKPAENAARLNNNPLVIDRATQDRDWSPTVALYANDHVPTWPDRFPLEASSSTVDTWGRLTETPIFVANCAILPFTYINQPPWTPVNYPSVTTPPTYTAVPPTEVIPPYGVEPDATPGSYSNSSTGGSSGGTGSGSTGSSGGATGR